MNTYDQEYLYFLTSTVVQGIRYWVGEEIAVEVLDTALVFTTNGDLDFWDGNVQKVFTVEDVKDQFDLLLGKQAEGTSTKIEDPLIEFVSNEPCNWDATLGDYVCQNFLFKTIVFG
jgi:hypothetical protein